MFRWFKRLVGLPFLTGVLLVPQQTDRIFVGIMDAKAKQITAQLTDVLLPMLNRQQRSR